jgi:hypothetical protein
MKEEVIPNRNNHPTNLLDCFVAYAPRNDDPPTPSLRAIAEGETIQKIRGRLYLLKCES